MGDKKRIAFVSNSLWSLFHFRINIIRRLVDQGYKVSVIAPPDETISKKINQERVEYIPLQHLQPRKMNIRQEWLLYKELKHLYTTLQPDLVFHYTIKPNIIGSFAAGAAKVKSISVITGLGYTLVKNSKVSFFIRPLYAKALKHPEEIWFLNEGDRSFFVANNMADTNKTFMLPGEGVDTDFFSFSSDITLRQRPLRFLMISRILNNKGVNEFAEAAQMFAGIDPHVEFVLMGKYEPDSPDAVPQDKMENWIKEKIILYLPYSEEVKNEIAEADCIVLPSYSEGLSVSLMEAASMTKPVIATNVSGCRELVIHNKTGFLCEPRNSADLFEKMNMFIALSGEQKKRMGEEGRKLMKEKYAVRIITDIYMDKIKACLQTE